jgi:hypothetical protein
MNIVRCRICKCTLIWEEVNKYRCANYDDLLFDTAGLVSFDGGINWIPDEFLQGDKKGRNPTEIGQNRSFSIGIAVTDN